MQRSAGSIRSDFGRTLKSIAEAILPQKLVTVFSIPELRTKILFTLGLLAIYRLGFWVPLPMVDQVSLNNWANQTQNAEWNRVFSHMAMFSGTELGNGTIFGLGIMPYISASIIFQLLASVIPSLEKLQKEGEAGRKKINEYTRYATVLICIIQSAFWVNYLWTYKIQNVQVVPEAYQGFYYRSVAVMTMTAGTLFLMWIGEQIDEYGIGNGISLIIMAGIVGRLPQGLIELWGQIKEFSIAPQDGIGVEKIIVMIALFFAVIIGVTLITQGQRKIPIQSAKHQRGRRVYGGTRQNLPLRVNQAGVMPIIFASSLLILATFPLAMLAQLWGGFYPIYNSFQSQGFLYRVADVALIYFFCYFWTAITFNPKDMANNLKDYGSFIPGYRPGKRTEDYLEKVMLRITYVGAGFLAVVAIIPSIVSIWLGVPYSIAGFFGGTGLLIIVSVALDLVQKIDSHLIMRNYDSLLQSSNQ